MANIRQYPFILQGDAEAAVIDILKNYTPELAAYATANDLTLYFSTDQIGYSADKVWIMVELEGGSYKYFRTKRSRVDITVFTPVGPNSRTNALDISQIIQASMFAWSAGYQGHGVNYQHVEVETDIFRGNDKDEDPVRYVQALRLLLLPQST